MINYVDETEYLLSSSKNAEHLRSSIEQYEKGNYQVRELIE